VQQSVIRTIETAGVLGGGGAMASGELKAPPNLNDVILYQGSEFVFNVGNVFQIIGVIGVIASFCYIIYQVKSK